MHATDPHPPSGAQVPVPSHEALKARHAAHQRKYARLRRPRHGRERVVVHPDTFSLLGALGASYAGDDKRRSKAQLGAELLLSPENQATHAGNLALFSPKYPEKSEEELECLKRILGLQNSRLLRRIRNVLSGLGIVHNDAIGLLAGVFETWAAEAIRNTLQELRMGAFSSGEAFNKILEPLISRHSRETAKSRELWISSSNAEFLRTLYSGIRKTVGAKADEYLPPVAPAGRVLDWLLSMRTSRVVLWDHGIGQPDLEEASRKRRSNPRLDKHHGRADPYTEDHLESRSDRNRDESTSMEAVNAGSSMLPNSALSADRDRRDERASDGVDSDTPVHGVAIPAGRSNADSIMESPAGEQRRNETDLQSPTCADVGQQQLSLPLFE